MKILFLYFYIFIFSINLLGSNQWSNLRNNPAGEASIVLDKELELKELDNHLYVLNAENGEIINCFFTGTPIWDQVAKGDTLWGSPVVLSTKTDSYIVHGSFNDTVYTIPVNGKCSLKAMARSSASLWWSLLGMLLIFLFIILPVCIMIKEK